MNRKFSPFIFESQPPNNHNTWPCVQVQRMGGGEKRMAQPALVGLFHLECVGEKPPEPWSPRHPGCGSRGRASVNWVPFSNYKSSIFRFSLRDNNFQKSMTPLLMILQIMIKAFHGPCGLHTMANVQISGNAWISFCEICFMMFLLSYGRKISPKIFKKSIIIFTNAASTKVNL